MMPKPVHLILLVGVAMLGGAATIWIAGDKRWTPPPPRLPDASLYQLPSSPGARFALAPEESLAARPLFSESRRPPAPDVAEGGSKDEPDPLRNVKVLGFFGSGKDAGGIFLLDGRVSRIRVGEKLGPWVLGAIKGTRAELSRPGRQRTFLELKHLPQPNAPSQAPAPSSSGRVVDEPTPRKESPADLTPQSKGPLGVPVAAVTMDVGKPGPGSTN